MSAKSVGAVVFPGSYPSLILQCRFSAMMSSMEESSDNITFVWASPRASFYPLLIQRGHGGDDRYGWHLSNIRSIWSVSVTCTPGMSKLNIYVIYSIKSNQKISLHHWCVNVISLLALVFPFRHFLDKKVKRLHILLILLLHPSYKQNALASSIIPLRPRHDSALWINMP